MVIAHRDYNVSATFVGIFKVVGMTGNVMSANIARRPRVFVYRDQIALTTMIVVMANDATRVIVSRLCVQRTMIAEGNSPAWVVDVFHLSSAQMTVIVPYLISLVSTIFVRCPMAVSPMTSVPRDRVAWLANAWRCLRRNVRPTWIVEPVVSVNLVSAFRRRGAKMIMTVLPTSCV